MQSQGQVPDASARLTLARRLAKCYSTLPQVEAIAMGGSEAAGKTDPASDLDLYVYVHTSIPIAERRRIAATQSDAAEVGNRFWGPGDVWVDDESGIDVDVMFIDVGWIEAHLDR